MNQIHAKNFLNLKKEGNLLILNSTQNPRQFPKRGQNVPKNAFTTTVTQ
jgi:hypothetical protein